MFGSIPIGESHTLLKLFSRDFGLILARAQSLRESKSKLRYGLQRYSECRVSLIQGKRGWKLTTASPVTSFYYELRNDPSRLAVAGRIIKNADRLVQGEERDEKLFSIILSGLKSLVEAEIEDLKTLEVLILARTLYVLGYLAEDQATQKFLRDVTLSQEIVKEFSPFMKDTMNKIHNSWQDSQL